MSYLLFLLDVRADPVSPVPWGALIVLLVIVFILAVGFIAGMVILLLWLRRRKLTRIASPTGQAYLTSLTGND